MCDIKLTVFKLIGVIVLVGLLIAVSGCSPILTSTRKEHGAEPGTAAYGWASWYGPGYHGKRTSNGEIYNMYALTAAHRTLPFGTFVKVTNLENGRSVIVRVNDRGPWKSGRIIDLSYKAANIIDMIGAGKAKVKLEVL